MSSNVFNPSEAATNPFNHRVRPIKITILYRFPVLSAGFFCLLFMTRIHLPRKRSALTLLTPYHYPEHLRHLPKQPHPNHLMKRFKKKTLNQNHKKLNNTTPSPSFHRPNKKPRKQHAHPNFQAEDQGQCQCRPTTSKILVNENVHQCPTNKKIRPNPV